LCPADVFPKQSGGVKFSLEELRLDPK